MTIGVSSEWGKTFNAARSATTMRTTITAERPRPIARRGSSPPAAQRAQHQAEEHVHQPQGDRQAKERE